MKVLEVQQLAKSFVQHRSELRRILSWFGASQGEIEVHWVLRDISFTMEPGEAIALVGQNGAGKSTLLKMIAGTQGATKGSSRSEGRVSAILELGMGFNPEFTGRQNAIYGLGLWGFAPGEIEHGVHCVEEFAEIGDYFDQPLRTYSSGMHVRLAFAVAVAFRPDLLIVDEALAVGDAYFQHKCISQIRQFQAEGTSLLLVSHDRTAIQALCTRAILLDCGQMRADGDVEEVMDLYDAMTKAADRKTVVQGQDAQAGKLHTSFGSGEATVSGITMFGPNGEEATHFGVGDAVELNVKIGVHQSMADLVFGYAIRDKFGQTVYGTNTMYSDQVITDPVIGCFYQFSVRFQANLGPGTYSVQTALVSLPNPETQTYEWRDRILVFEIENRSKQFFLGTNWIEPEIRIAKLS